MEGQLSDWGEQKKARCVVHIFNLYTGELAVPNCRPSCVRASSRALGETWRYWALLTFLVIGALLVRDGTLATGKSSTDNCRSRPTTERRLTYSLMVRPGSKGKPFQMAREMIFPAGYGVQLNVNSPQAGFLYIINEGPEEKNGLPQFNVLFPNTLTDSNSASLRLAE